MDDARAEQKERIFNGISASPGIAFGEAFVMNVEDLAVSEEHIAPEQVDAETEKFLAALAQTEKELQKLVRSLEDEIGEEHGKILDSHRMILKDELFRSETIKMIKGKKVNAAYALSLVLDKVLTTFANIKDEYLKERAEDIRDVRRRVLRNLLGQRVEGITSLRKKAVVVARTLTPSDTAGLNKKYVLAFVTDAGGSTSHAAILARSQGIPAVVGLNDISKSVRPYDDLIVDGITGQVVVNPAPETVAMYREMQARYNELEKNLLTLRDYPGVTLDGHQIELSANIEIADEVEDVVSHGARGVGLFRTEYFFITRNTLPSEEEQYRYYSSVVKRVQPDPVIIRTLDVGGDKIARWVGDLREANPFMGWRGIRFTLARKDIFKTQLRAIYRAAAHGNVKIMFPMVSVLDEVRLAREICEEVKDDLKRQRYVIGERPEIGVMIETPSAVAIADLLAREVDFFSIGTNDLVQYALAVDRGNAKISYLYDTLHPSILRLLRDTVAAAHKNKIWVGICGEMPGNIYGALLLLGLGLDEFSAASYLIPTIKKIVRSVTYDETRSLVRKALAMGTAREVRELVDRFIHEKRPELREFHPEAAS
ncbi:MAG: phosphoenolpyruvate--protein phosphotransferase [Candidatus Krumholzibacteria bacterium]|nr:phosphoenolpyruvate--protein phosphotransferase [Candidatus Krumholzibacteria bacterium]